MATTLDELLEKYLNDERYPDADPEEMKAQVIRLFNKYEQLEESTKLYMIDSVLVAKFGERPKVDFQPLDLDLYNTLKEKGIL